MTWIVGAAGPWHPFIAGDIRVTWPNGVTADCLQKIYPVTKNLIGGFAGSVTLGFDVLSAIYKQAPDEPDPWDLARRWLPRLMRRKLREAEARAPGTNLSSQISLVGYNPKKETIPGLHPSIAFKFSSPRFERQSVRSGLCLGIGSGHDVEDFRKVVQEAYDGLSMMRMNAGRPYVTPLLMADRLRELLEENPHPSVSKWFVFGSITPRGYLVEPFSIERGGANGPVKIAAPPIARSAAEFEKFAKDRGLVAAAAVA